MCRGLAVEEQVNTPLCLNFGGGKERTEYDVMLWEVKE